MYGSSTTEGKWDYDTPLGSLVNAKDDSEVVSLFGELHGKLEFKTPAIKTVDYDNHFKKMVIHKDAEESIEKALQAITKFRDCASDSSLTLSAIFRCVTKDIRYLKLVNPTDASFMDKTFQAASGVGVQTNVGLPFALFTPEGVRKVTETHANNDELMGCGKPRLESCPLFNVAVDTDRGGMSEGRAGFLNLGDRMIKDNIAQGGGGTTSKNWHAMLPKICPADSPFSKPELFLSASQQAAHDSGTGKPLKWIKLEGVGGCVIEYRRSSLPINSRFSRYVSKAVRGGDAMAVLRNALQFIVDSWNAALSFKSSKKAGKFSQIHHRLQRDIRALDRALDHSDV